MNINQANEDPQDFSLILNIEASPYLSPLFGSISLQQENSYNEFTDFHLEDQPVGTEQEFRETLLENSLMLGVLSAHSHQGMEVFLHEEIKIQKCQVQTPVLFYHGPQSNVHSIITFLVNNNELKESDLKSIGKPFYENSSQFEYIFDVLMKKFKALKKTKEEMVKFCMRKAFKFVSDLKKLSKSKKGRKDRFEKNDEKNLNLEMPFRKNSSQKTMNIQFLKQVFSSSEFCEGYHKFLQSISEIIEEDNNGKIKYLSDTISKHLRGNELEEIEKIKRLPWTKSILNRTQELARSLAKFTEMENSEES